MATILLPVGQPLGLFTRRPDEPGNGSAPAAGAPAAPDGGAQAAEAPAAEAPAAEAPAVESAVATVRVGGDYHELSPAGFRIWMLTMLTGDRDQTEKTAATDGIDGGPARIDELLGGGLLVGYDPDTDDLRPVFVHLRLVPMGIGLGESDDPPGTVSIAGYDMQPRASVPPDLYSIWSHGPYRSLWSEFEDIAKAMGADTETVARSVAASLPVLVQTGCGFLDRPR